MRYVLSRSAGHLQSAACVYLYCALASRRFSSAANNCIDGHG